MLVQVDEIARKVAEVADTVAICDSADVDKPQQSTAARQHAQAALAAAPTQRWPRHLPRTAIPCSRTASSTPPATSTPTLGSRRQRLLSTGERLYGQLVSHRLETANKFGLQCVCPCAYGDRPALHW